MMQDGYFIPTMDDGSRVYYCIQNGRMYHINETPELKDLAPGYYDAALNPVTDEAALGDA